MLFHSLTRFITELLIPYDKVVFLGPGAVRKNEEKFIMVVLKNLHSIKIDNIWVPHCSKREISKTFLIKSKILKFLYLFFFWEISIFLYILVQNNQKAPILKRTMILCVPRVLGSESQNKRNLQIQGKLWQSTLLRMRIHHSFVC